MTPIFQLIRCLSELEFEKLCFQLLREKYPRAGLVKVEGRGGDKGVDLFAGRLLGRVHIWQCKHFPNGVKGGQRKKIEKSLEAALAHHKPKAWTLCLSVDLDRDGHIWFQNLQRLHAEQLKISLVQASDLELELNRYRSIREQFFPGSQIDIRHLKEALAKTGKLTNEELQTVTKVNAQDYLDRLQDLDPRLAFRLTFSSSGAPPSLGESPFPRVPNGAVASVVSGDTRIDIIAKDVEALELDPLTGSFQLKGEAAIEKFHRFLSRGTTEVFESEEIEKVELPLPSLLSGEFHPQKMILGPSTDISEKEYFWKVSFSLGDRNESYGLIRFVKTREGTEETEVCSSEDSLPFQIRVTIGRQSGGKVNIRSCWDGRDAHAVLKAFQALRILQNGGAATFVDIRTDRQLFKVSAPARALTENEKKFDNFVSELVEISNTFGVPIRMMQNMTSEDVDVFKELLEIARTGRTLHNASQISMSLRKQKDSESEFVAWGDTERALFAPLTEIETRTMMGSRFELGRRAVYCKRVALREAEKTCQRYLAASEGEPLNLTFEPRAPVENVYERFSLNMQHEVDNNSG